MRESGEATFMNEVTRREGVDDSSASYTMHLTTLAPDIVAAILDETLPPEGTIFDLAAGTPVLWEAQGRNLDWDNSRFRAARDGGFFALLSMRRDYHFACFPVEIRGWVSYALPS
jgi:hypothetical protein